MNKEFKTLFDKCPYCGKILKWKSNHITRAHINKGSKYNDKKEQERI